MKGLHVPFMANDGQMDERVSFYAKIFGGIGKVTAEGKSLTGVNYIKGNAPSAWRKNIPTYGPCQPGKSL